MIIAGHRLNQKPEGTLADWIEARVNEGVDLAYMSYQDLMARFGNKPIGTRPVSEREQLETYLAKKDDQKFWNDFLDSDQNGRLEEVKPLVAHQYVAQMAKLYEKYYGEPLVEKQPEPPAPVQAPETGGFLNSPEMGTGNPAPGLPEMPSPVPSAPPEVMY